MIDYYHPQPRIPLGLVKVPGRGSRLGQGMRKPWRQRRWNQSQHQPRLRGPQQPQQQRNQPPRRNLRRWAARAKWAKSPVRSLPAGPLSCLSPTLRPRNRLDLMISPLPALRHHLSFQVLEWVNNFLMTWLNKTQTSKPGPGLTSSTSFGVQQNPLFKPPRVPGYNPESDARGPGLRPTTNPGLNIPRVPRFPRRQLRPRSGGFYNYRTYRGFQLWQGIISCKLNNCLWMMFNLRI